MNKFAFAPLAAGGIRLAGGIVSRLATEKAVKTGIKLSVNKSKGLTLKSAAKPKTSSVAGKLMNFAGQSALISGMTGSGGSKSSATPYATDKFSKTGQLAGKVRRALKNREFPDPTKCRKGGNTAEPNLAPKAATSSDADVNTFR